jgi:peptidoglycan/LPS O-acetylase OafA/YrhL
MTGRDDESRADFRILGRVPALDGVRGVAIVLVVWWHLGCLDVVAPNLRIKAGFLGVDVFFVLSGFLITALMLGEQARH